MWQVALGNILLIGGKIHPTKQEQTMRSKQDTMAANKIHNWPTREVHAEGFAMALTALSLIMIEKPLNALQKSIPCKKAKNVTKRQAIYRKNGWKSSKGESNCIRTKKPTMDKN